MRFGLLLGALSACTGGGTTSPPAEGAPPNAVEAGAPSIAQAIVDARVEGTCAEPGVMTLGSFGPPAAPVKDGDAASVACKVKPVGAAFAVTASATTGYSSSTRSIELSGTFTSTGDQAGVALTVRPNVGHVGRDCVAGYPSSFQGIASGRLWAEVTCATSDGCRIAAQLRFENCAQE